MALCDLLELPLQVPAAYRGPVPRLVAGGRDYYGVLGHRDNTDQRGRGDPGDEIFRRLVEAGADPFELAARQDMAAWSRRQRILGVPVDGLPGPRTMAALRARGMRCGREL